MSQDYNSAASLNLSHQECLTPSERERGSGERDTQKPEDNKSCTAVKKYNKIGADKVRKSRTSYENIYHSRNFWLQRVLELICVFLRGGAFGSGWGILHNPGLFGLLLIHNLLEVVIRTMKSEEKGGGGVAERGSGQSEKKSRNGALMLLGDTPQC